MQRPNWSVPVRLRAGAETGRDQVFAGISCGRLERVPHPPIRWPDAEAAKSTQSRPSLQCRAFTGADSMPVIQAELRPIPSIVPIDIPDMTDDECLARLARVVEEQDSGHLD